MKSNNNGFTLVEVIVVLVILAIMAAIIVPSMTGWIDKAKQQSAIVPCRTCVTAAQTLASEQYGLSATGAISVTPEAVLELAGLTGSGQVTSLVFSGELVDKLTYKPSGGEEVTYLRSPEPHYVFGAVSASVSAIAGETLSEMYDVYSGLKNNGGGSYTGNVDSTGAIYAPKILEGLSDEEKQFLSGKTWRIQYANTDSGAKEPRIFFTMTEYPTSGEGSNASNVVLYKYDPATKLYQRTNYGIIKNGNISANTKIWSSWDTWDNTVQ